MNSALRTEYLVLEMLDDGERAFADDIAADRTQRVALQRQCLPVQVWQV